MYIQKYSELLKIERNAEIKARYNGYNSSQLAREYDLSERYVRTICADNPNLRDVNYANGLNEIKRQIEFNCSLAYGTLSNPQNVDKTAEEIKASKQRSYTAVSDMQHSLEAVLEDYIYACNAIADACNLAPSGEYEVSFNWGDGVLEDKDKEQSIQLNEVNSGIRKKTDYLKWRYGVDDKQATEMLPESGVESFFDEGGGT